MLAGVFCWNWMVGNHKRKMLSRGVIQDWKSRLACDAIFAQHLQVGGMERWPRSKHTGSLLPNTLRGKSPCLGAESATGRPEDLYSGAVSEAFGGVVVLVFGPLQQQSYAMSVCKNANWTGLTLSMPPTCRCWAKMASQASLDFQSWMIPCDNSFPLVVANHSVSTKNASQHTMWQLLFVDILIRQF